MNIYLELLAALVRAALTTLAGMLVQHGLITAVQAKELTTSAAGWITAGIAAFLVALWHSWRAKILAAARTRAAAAANPRFASSAIGAVAPGAMSWRYIWHLAKSLRPETAGDPVSGLAVPTPKKALSQD